MHSLDFWLPELSGQVNSWKESGQKSQINLNDNPEPFKGEVHHLLWCHYQIWSFISGTQPQNQGITEVKPPASTPGCAAYIRTSQLFWSFTSSPQNTLCWADPRSSRDLRGFYKIPLQFLVSLEAPPQAADLMGTKSYPRSLQCQRGSPGADLPILFEVCSSQ